MQHNPKTEGFAQISRCQKFLSHPLINPKKASTFTSGRQQTHYIIANNHHKFTCQQISWHLSKLYISHWTSGSSYFGDRRGASFIRELRLLRTASISSYPIQSTGESECSLFKWQVSIPHPYIQPPPTVGGPNPIPTITTHRTCLRSCLHHLLFLLPQELQSFIQLSALGRFL